MLLDCIPKAFSGKPLMLTSVPLTTILAPSQDTLQKKTTTITAIPNCGYRCDVPGPDMIIASHVNDPFRGTARAKPRALQSRQSNGTCVNAKTDFGKPYNLNPKQPKLEDRNPYH